MTSKSLTFRFPIELAEAINAQAQATGKDKTTVVVEILASAFDLPFSAPVAATSQTPHQQIQQLEADTANLSKKLAELRQNVDWDHTTQSRLTALEQATHQFLGNGNGKDCEPPDNSWLDQTHKDLIPLDIDHQPTRILNQILSAFSDLVLVQDRMGRFTYINLTGTQVLGFKPSYILGKTPLELGFPPDVTETLATQRQIVFSTRQPSNCEINFPTVYGERNYEAIFSPIQGVKGSIESVVCTARDITQRKQGETALRESEEKYRNLFELANDLIFIIDATTHRLLNANWNAARQLGYTRKELLDLSLNDIEAPMETPRRQAILQKLQDDGSIIYEHTLRRKDGSQMPVEISTQVIEYGNRLAFQSFGRDITRRQEVELELRTSEARYRAIVEGQTELICRFVPGGKLTFVNSAYCRYFGQSPEALIGQSFMPLIPVQDWQHVQQQLSHIDQGNPLVTFEHRVILPTGEIRWQQWSHHALFDEQNNLIECQAVGRDITERKQVEHVLQQLNEELETRVQQRTTELIHANAQLQDEINQRRQVEEALRDSEARFRAIFQQAAVGITQVDSSGHFLQVNQRFCDILGYTEAELVGRTFHEITHPDDAKADQAYIAQIVAGQMQTFSLEKRYIRKDGQVRWANVSVSVVRKRESTPNYFIRVVEDITKRKQVQEVLTQREWEFRTLLEHSPDIIARFDRQLRHVYVNPVVAQVTGIPYENFIGKTNHELGMPDELVSYWSQALYKVFDTGENEVIEFEFPSPTGLRRYQSHLVPEFTSDGAVEFVLCVSREITPK